MEKKVILVTGSSSGIGKETAKTLAKEGHTIILHGRNAKKTKEVYDEIKKDTGNNNIDMLIADLSLMSEVKLFSEKIKSKYDHLDVLINNAGGQFGRQRETTEEGHEKTMAINVLAPFLLTYFLVDLLQKSESARVVTVSSASYTMGGKIDFNDIELENNYSLAKAYGLSKRYIIWIMRRFVKEMEFQGISNITFNTLEPGSADSDLGRIATKNFLAKIVYWLWKPMMWSLEKASATSVYLATSDEVEGKTGNFYSDCKEKQIKDKFLSEEGEKLIWNYCMDVSSI